MPYYRSEKIRFLYKICKIPVAIKRRGACMHFLFTSMLSPQFWIAAGILVQPWDPKQKTLHIFVIHSLRLRQIALKPKSLERTGFGRSGKKDALFTVLKLAHLISSAL